MNNVYKSLCVSDLLILSRLLVLISFLNLVFSYVLALLVGASCPKGLLVFVSKRCLYLFYNSRRPCGAHLKARRAYSYKLSSEDESDAEGRAFQIRAGEWGGTPPLIYLITLTLVLLLYKYYSNIKSHNCSERSLRAGDWGGTPSL